MTYTHKHAARSVVAASLIAGLSAGAANATEGFFQNGFGAREKAMAGAGVANGTDATSAALNPAGIVHAQDEFDSSTSLFMPFREFTGGAAPGFTPSGTIESTNNIFAIPNMARNWRTPDNPYFDAFTLSVVGNGGMNTTYRNAVGGLGCPVGTPGTGVYCFGKTGVDLQQMLVSAAMAKQFGNISVGIAPTAALQIFSDRGLQAFGGASIDPGNLSNRGTDYALGLGLRAGIEWAITPSMRVGVAGSTPIWSQAFDKYRGLFADQGGFDVPANIQAGVAVDMMPGLTFMLDYRHIWFSETNAIGDPSTLLLAGIPLGANKGPGFGWKDVDAIKAGVEWKMSNDLTLRAGYSYNTQPVNSRDVMINILAPAVIKHHITGGFLYKWSDNIDLEFAAMYAPREHVTGAELPGFGNPAHTIDISMEQFEATFGVKYKFGAESASLK